MSDSVGPQRQQPTRLPRPWDSPGKNTGVGGHFLLQCMKVKRESEVAQSCPTLSDPMDCSLPGSSIYGIFQGRVLEWGAIAGCNFLSLSHHNKNLKRQKLKASACHSSHTVLQLCVYTCFPVKERKLLSILWPGSVFNGLRGCWRRQWHPTPVLLPGKSHGRRSLVGCSPWGC